MLNHQRWLHLAQLFRADVGSYQQAPASPTMWQPGRHRLLHPLQAICRFGSYDRRDRGSALPAPSIREGMEVLLLESGVSRQKMSAEWQESLFLNIRRVISIPILPISC